MGSGSKILILLIAVCLLFGCSKQAPAPVKQYEDDSIYVLPASPIDTATFNQRQQLIQSELDYYLQRHNVQDEGFDMVARYAEEGDSTLAAYLPDGHFGLMSFFQWHDFPREGKCMTTDSYGRIIIGTFHSDTLVSGIRIDSLGTYAGQFDRHLQASGHGSYQSADGTYYEGHWENDRRQGFGFSVSPKWLKAGQWRKNRFLGERMKYTSERIYGIDISRYQHEKGRMRYDIYWKKLRITHLGRRISQERVNGEVDYPVTFVYIKSTEGISIKNRYYANDYLSCHREGIRVGAYHFFSTRQDPALQASHFLKNTTFRKGDMPPMLDIEPSDELIMKMGGPEILFKNVRIWNEIIERHTGVKPLLYVNQRFVNTWLDYAPDIKQNYHFWIARYGEYKPDIHLSIWQLSADGRVSGIRGDVDLNVFNGYQGQWDEFLREYTIK